MQAGEEGRQVGDEIQQVDGQHAIRRLRGDRCIVAVAAMDLYRGCPSGREPVRDQGRHVGGVLDRVVTTATAEQVDQRFRQRAIARADFNDRLAGDRGQGLDAAGGDEVVDGVHRFADADTVAATGAGDSLDLLGGHAGLRGG